MARHIIQIPTNKSSNKEGVFTGYEVVFVPKVSDSLYIGVDCQCGVGWDNTLIPTNKNIVSVKLKIYAESSLYMDIVATFMDFSEGGNMPKPSTTDFAKSSLSSGWNTFDLGAPPLGALIIQAFVKDYNRPWPYSSFRSSRASSNRPYIEVVYDDIPPEKPSSLYPSGITINPRDVIRFAWEHNSKENNQQKGFTLQYKVDNGNWVTVTQATPSQFYDMPANTLPTTGTITWQVRTTDGNDEVSTYTASSFTLGVVPQKAPNPVSPISQYIDESEPIKFEWNFTGGSSNETQSKFELQYSKNGGNTWITETRITSDTFLILDPLNTGNITWRIRTYNNWDEVSPYSENRSFTIIGSPPIPLIQSISNSGMPLINWQSQEQHLYELEILEGNKVIFDSGIIPSTSDKQFKLPIYLKDGNYKVKLRVFNEFNLESPWAEKTFIISTTKPIKPITRVFTGEYSCTITISNQTAKNLIYRDNILIGVAKDNQFVDYTGENEKEYKYFVRAVDAGDNFADSDIELGKCSFRSNTLSTIENPEDFIILKYGFGAIPGKNKSVSNIGSLNYYDGREYPVAEFTEFRSLEKGLSFFIKTKEDVEELIKLIDEKKTLLYRDFDGENIKGIVFAISINKTILGYNVGFTITKTEV